MDFDFLGGRSHACSTMSQTHTLTSMVGEARVVGSCSCSSSSCGGGSSVAGGDSSTVNAGGSSSVAAAVSSCPGSDSASPAGASSSTTTSTPPTSPRACPSPRSSFSSTNRARGLRVGAVDGSAGGTAAGGRCVGPGEERVEEV